MRLIRVLAALAVPACLAGQPVPTAPQAGIVSSADSSPATLGLARGSLFTIYGANLASGTASANLPYPTTLAGAAVHFRSGTSVIDAPLLYASPSQINGIVPSGIAGQFALVSVETAAGESQGQTLPLVESRFTAFANGLLPFGPALVQQYRPSGITLNRLLDPAVPGDALVIWGTGLGSEVRQDVTVYIGGTPVAPFYAGPAPGQPGLSQINFYLSPEVPSRCFMPLVVRTGTQNSAEYTISTALGSGARCGLELLLGPGAREALDQGGTVQLAALSVLAPDAGAPIAEAWVGDYNSTHLSAIATHDLAGAAPLVCTRNSYDRYTWPPQGALPAPFYGRPSNAPLTVSLGGDSGCSWTFLRYGNGVYHATGPAGCPAQQFSLRDPIGSSGGAVPAAPPASAPDIRLSRSASAISASWANPSGGRLTLDFSSSFTFGGGIFTAQTEVRQLTCRLSGLAGSGEIATADFDWAMGLPSSRSMLYHLSLPAAIGWTNWSTPTGAVMIRTSRVLSGPLTVQ